MKERLHKELRVIVAFSIGCAIAFLFSSCDAIADSDIPTRDIDWQQVEAISSTDAMGVMIELTRDLDRWHKGTIERLRVSYSGVYLHDDTGNRKEISPEEWKGLVTLVYNGIQASPDDYMVMRTAPADVYDFDDGEGQIQRYIYYVRMIDTENLEFQTIRASD